MTRTGIIRAQSLLRDEEPRVHNEEPDYASGFTLIELLIVIVILGILATVVTFAVSGVTDRGQTGACEADRATLEVAVEAYFGRYSTLSLPSGGAGNDEYEMSIRDAGFLHRVSSLWDVDANGGMTPQGSTCS